MVFIDLLLYSEENVLSLDELLKKHASNLNYFKFLPADFSCKVVQHAGFSGLAKMNGVTYEIIKAKNNRWAVPFGLFYRLRKEKPDVILFHSMVYALQIIFLKLIVGKRTRIIVQNHAEKPWWGAKAVIQRIAGNFISAYFFASAEQAEPWIRKKIIKDRHKVHAVMEGSTLFTRKPQHRQDDRMNFIWVGRLDKNKDPLTVLNAFGRYAKQNPKIKLRMIYHTTELLAEVTAFIKKNDLLPYVELVGRVAHETLEDFYNAADYFILGSHDEGSGYALCEAMACGCVPVVTAIPSFKAMLDNGACGYLFEPGNSEDLYQKLLALDLKDKDVISKKVLEKFERDLSFRAIGKSIADVALKLRSK